MALTRAGTVLSTLYVLFTALQQPRVSGTAVIPLSQVGKVRHREVK